jgi:predicted metal-dependent hydrolase
VRGTRIEVVRKDIKNLHVGVYPPNGRVRVAAPRHLDDSAVRLAVVTRMGWIRRQQAGFERQERQSQRDFVTGESHYFEGRRYRLSVVETAGPPEVELVGSRTLKMRIRPKTGRARREAILNAWYKDRLRNQFPALLAKWEPRVGVQVAELRIKRMKTRWGTCNAGARRIWLNLELAKKPLVCLEYIFVHEMVHFLERHHNEAFRTLMNRLLPTWQQCRKELNRAPLSHEDWAY